MQPIKDYRHTVTSDNGKELSFHKGTNFTRITDKQIIEAQERLNHRPRKFLGYKTPFEVFFGTIAENLAS